MNRSLTDKLGAGTLPIATIALLSVTGIGCTRAKPKPAPAQPAAATPAKPAAKPAPTPQKAEAPKGNVTSTSSEHIASGEPQAAKPSPEGSTAPPYHGKPQMELDSKTLADVRSTIEQTCQLLEEGVDLLEKHAKTPEKAAKAINKYRKKHAARIQQVFKDAADVRARLRSVGYDQDIPAQVRPEFEKRMGGIQARLEKMRHVYAKHRDVLEAFGQLFPRTQ